jgi:hypothetical protein
MIGPSSLPAAVAKLAPPTAASSVPTAELAAATLAVPARVAPVPIIWAAAVVAVAVPRSSNQARRASKTFVARRHPAMARSLFLGRDERK